MWFQIFANIDLADFIKGAIVGGLTWDLVKIGAKNYVLKPLMNAFERLIEDNKNNSLIDIKRIEFEFNDATIRILGIRTQHISKLSLVFQELIKAYPRIEQKGIGNLSDIVLPLVESGGRYKLVGELTDLPDATDYVKYWLIEFELGLEKYVYDVPNDTILE